MYKSFEDYLKSIHAEQADGVLDDELADNFEDWVTNEIMQDEIFMHADNYANLKWKQGREQLLLLQKLERESKEEVEEKEFDDEGDFSGVTNGDR